MQHGVLIGSDGLLHFAHFCTCCVFRARGGFHMRTLAGTQRGNGCVQLATALSLASKRPNESRASHLIIASPPKAPCTGNSGMVEQFVTGLVWCWHQNLIQMSKIVKTASAL
eukprot:4414372-Amphidinium_carterae.1